jgi:diguanylate cyclase (GGDEF)-like protein
MLTKVTNSRGIPAEQLNSHSEEFEHTRLIRYSVGGTLVHFLLLAFFIYDQLDVLIYFNVVALSAWLFCIYLVKQKHYRTVVLVSSVILYIQLNLATIIYGKESGFLMGLWPLACIFVVNIRTNIIIGSVFATLCLLSFILLSLYVPESTNRDFLPLAREIFIICCGAAMVSGIMSIKSSFRRRRNKMIHVANHDALTGLKNRRFFSTFISHQQEVVKREGKPYCLAMGDIDHFKQINDQHGHHTGDAVLIKIADCFNDILAQSDVICRWGGEEFLIFIPESDLEKAYPVLEAIREVISDLDINGIKPTISFGLVNSDGSQSLDELVKAADILLYKAKSAGRNKVVYE